MELLVQTIQESLKYSHEDAEVYAKWLKETALEIYNSEFGGQEND